LTGIKAVKAVVTLHHSLEREAKRLGIKRLISMSNHLDERNTFVRILEKEGWDRRHYLATKTV
jgi:tRNA 2-selenouridine synthase SelU